MDMTVVIDDIIVALHVELCNIEGKEAICTSAII